MVDSGDAADQDGTRVRIGTVFTMCWITEIIPDNQRQEK